MPATNAVNAFGTLLKIGDGGGSEVFTTIAEVTNISGPSLSLDTIEVTNHSSTNGWKERIAGLLDAGEVTFDINYLPTDATHSFSAGLVKDMVNRTKRNFKIVFPNTGNTTWTFSAFVTKFQPKAPTNDRLTASVSLMITGQPTLA
jgi:predicted secreted protein